MSNQREQYYEKAVNLLLSVSKELRGENPYIKRNELTDRKSKILVKEYGPTFSRENVLFSEKFLIFAPSFVATYDALHSYSFEDDVVPNKILKFNRIKKIQYSLMPCQTSICITTTSGATMELFSGVPKGETYAAIKAYEQAVQTGAYKAYTLFLLSCIYALTALCRCKPIDYEDTYKKIEKNIKQLVEYYKDDKNNERKYGDFFSFDFVTCEYNPDVVERALEKIIFVAQEAHEERTFERKEQFAQALERQMDKAREQLENQRK